MPPPSDKPSALPGFTKLNPIVSLRPSSTPSAASSPHTIIILTWLGATTRQIAKYVDGFLKTAPSARVYLIRSDYVEYSTKGFPRQREELSIVAKDLLTVPDNDTLIVCFSNGGAMKLCSLAEAYRKLSNEPLKAKAMILDSCPGRISKQSGVNAALPALPKPWFLYYPSLLVLLVVATSVSGFYDLAGIEDTMERNRRLLNDPEHFSKDSERCYVFSDKDNIVVERDVVDHSAEAEKKGLKVRMEKFEGSVHCAHLRADEGDIGGLWMSCWDEISRELVYDNMRGYGGSRVVGNSNGNLLNELLHKARRE